jgi:hypothetical protein
MRVRTVIAQCLAYCLCCCGHNCTDYGSAGVGSSGDGAFGVSGYGGGV